MAGTPFWKARNVDYKMVPEPKDVNLTPWRGRAREEVRITKCAAKSVVISERRQDGGSMNYISQNGTAPIFLRPHDVQSGKNDTAQVR